MSWILNKSTRTSETFTHRLSLCHHCLRNPLIRHTSDTAYLNKKYSCLDSPLPSLQIWSGSLTIHIKHLFLTQSRILHERELTWALNSKEIDTVVLIHRRNVFHRGEGSPRNYHLHSPPLPLLVLFPLLLSLIGIGVCLIAMVISALLYVDQNTLGSLHVTANCKVTTKFVWRDLVEAYRHEWVALEDRQSDIERELDNWENQENIPPPPAYVAPEPPAANPTNARRVFESLPILPQQICIRRDWSAELLPNRPRTPNPGFHYRYNPTDFLTIEQETDPASFRKHVRRSLRISDPWRQASQYWIDLDSVSKHQKLSKTDKERFHKSINSIAKHKSSSNPYSPKSAYGKLLKQARKLKKSIK